MKEIVLVFPNQLFSENILLSKNKTIVLLEEPRYFTDFLFHKQKLVLHRASMQEYYNNLKIQNYNVKYIEYNKVKSYINSIDSKTIVNIIDPVDHKLKNELNKKFNSKKVVVKWHETLMFLTSSELIEQSFKNKKKFSMRSFYIDQRKRLNILIENGKPVGGKCSFDKENREKIPDNIKIPELPNFSENNYIKEAKEYILKNFPQNPGDIKNFIYPINTKNAKIWLKDFLESRLKNFGKYQDAINKNNSYLFHSILSPVLNTGLLTPKYVISQTLSHAKKNKIPINSLEGFIRQIIGWREFVRAVYQIIGQEQRESNFFNNKRELPESFYTAKTNIDPVDNIIEKIKNTAYSHHIERLMVLGNIMLLLEIKPDNVYNWFMEMYIDSYDWVMVPNVYGMSQFADTQITTKPYITSSNYILKMSNYKKGSWCEDWDALFWTFVKKNEKNIDKIPRMRFIMGNLKRKNSIQLKNYQRIVQDINKKFKK